MVKITPAAISVITNEIQDVIDEGNIPMIRLSMGIGWGGPKLRLTLEESALESDEIVEESGIQFLINERDKVYFDHVKVDYTKNLFGGGQFIIIRL